MQNIIEEALAHKACISAVQAPNRRGLVLKYLINDREISCEPDWFETDWANVSASRPVRFGTTVSSLVIRKSEFLSTLKALVGFADVQIGAPDFDARYEVQAGIPDYARASLALPEVQSAIDELFELVSPPSRSSRLPGAELRIESNGDCMLHRATHQWTPRPALNVATATGKVLDLLDQNAGRPPLALRDSNSARSPSGLPTTFSTD